MDSQVILSIIIPHYNSADSLRKLIDSIPEIEEIEIIVVDDNSTKDLDVLKQVRDYRPNQVHFYANETGKNSAGRCRNIGLQKASGQWLMFADADDYFVGDFWNVVRPYTKEEYDLVYFLPTSLDIRTGKVSNRHVSLENLLRAYANDSRIENEVKLRYLWAAPYCKLVRKSIVDEKGIVFDETMVANDVMFSARIGCAANRVYADPTVIYCITKNDGTLEMTKTRKYSRNRLRVNVRKYRFLKKNAGKEAFRILDFRISYYMCIMKRNHCKWIDYVWAWCYCLMHGVRPFLSRKWTIPYAMRRIEIRK